MEKRSLSIIIGEDEIASLKAGRPVAITLTPRRPIIANRKDRVAADRLAVGIHSPDVQRLLDAWNRSEYILDHPHEGRNKPLTDDEAIVHRVALDKAVKTFGLESLLDSINMYFDACLEGRHLQNGRNVGYGNLAGFCRKMLQVKGDRRKLWWAGGHAKIPDSHSELTKQIADAYAKKFLGRPTYGLRNPSGEYREFATAADWVELTTPKSGLSPDRTVGYLMGCVDEQAKQRNRSVTPAWLSSELTWRNCLPQFIKRILG